MDDELCPNCGTRIEPGHKCRVIDHLNSDTAFFTQMRMMRRLSKWHDDPMKEMVRSVKDDEIHMTPAYYDITTPGKTDEMEDEIRIAVMTVINKGDDIYFGSAEVPKIYDEVNASNEVEKAFVNKVLDRMVNAGDLVKSDDGYKFP